MIPPLKRFLTDKRSVVQFTNIYTSFIYKITGVAANFITVGLLVSQLTNGEYGILITIISVTSWFTFLDLGLGNGLKNKLAVAFAGNRQHEARMLVSTSYFVMGAFVVCLLAIFCITFPFIRLDRFILGRQATGANISRLLHYSLILFCSRMVFDLIHQVLLADQKAGVSSLIQLISQLLVLAAFLVLKYAFNSTNIFEYGLFYFLAPLATLLCANIFLLLKRYAGVKPSFAYFEKPLVSSLFSLGLQFFVIQIAFIVVFTTDNLIIGRVLGYDQVTSYNIAFRYFSLITFCWNVVLAPLWTAFSEAYTNGDISWIYSTIKRLERLGLLMAGVAFVMLLASNLVYKLWVGNSVSVPFRLSAVIMIFVVLNAFANIYVFFLNGINKVKWQVYLSIVASISNIPLSLLFAKTLHWGNTGVITASIICILPSSIYARKLCFRIINKVDAA